MAIETRQNGVIHLAEYEVEFKDGVRRRFLELHLRIFSGHEKQSARPSRPHLLLNEIIARWSFSRAEVDATNGDRNRLVELLRAQFDFSQRRAEREIDTVLADFAERLHRAKTA